MNHRPQLKRLGRMKECERCNYSKYPEILVAHHKDRNPRNRDLKNIEILCPNCHALEHYEDGRKRFHNGLNGKLPAKYNGRPIDGWTKEVV